MAKQEKNLLYNKKFGHFLALLFFIILSVVFYNALTHMKYQWKWTGVGKYFVYTKTSTVDSPINGVVEISSNKVTVKGLEETQDIKIPSGYKLSLENGENVFEGDSIASESHLAPGPLVLGLIVTIKISILSAIIALFIGILIAFMRVSSFPFFNSIGTVYVAIIRGTPLLVQIFIFYFIIATVFHLDRFLAGALSLGIFCGAYIAEVLRGAIQSINEGQVEAAKSLGMNYFQTMRFIVMPQALKRSLPALVGEMIALVKDSSLVSVISITDLTKTGREIISNTYATFETWIIVAIMYLCITFFLSFIGHRIEKRMKTQGGM